MCVCSNAVVMWCSVRTNTHEKCMLQNNARFVGRADEALTTLQFGACLVSYANICVCINDCIVFMNVRRCSAVGGVGDVVDAAAAATASATTSRHSTRRVDETTAHDAAHSHRLSTNVRIYLHFVFVDMFLSSPPNKEAGRNIAESFSGSLSLCLCVCAMGMWFAIASRTSVL